MYSYIEDTLHLKIAYAEKEISTPERERSGYAKVLDMKQYDMVVNVETLILMMHDFQYTNAIHGPDKFRFNILQDA